MKQGIKGQKFSRTCSTEINFVFFLYNNVFDSLTTHITFWISASTLLHY